MPAHAVESLDEFAALAPTPVAPPRFALATWLSPCPVWQDPLVEMLPFDEPASAVTRPGTLIRVASKWFVEPVLVVAELATISPRHLTFRTSRLLFAPPCLGVLGGLDRERFERGDELA